jgi:acyl-CoA synthetase (AMP-forming)/AMP-acid ligase II
MDTEKFEAYNCRLDRRNPWEDIVKLARRTPDAIAFVFLRRDDLIAPVVALTYDALAKRIGVIATRLARLGVDNAHPAAIVASESLEAVIALYAAELAGRAIVMLPEEDIGHNVRLARLLGVKVAVVAADEFDPELVRRLRAEAEVEHVLHMNDHDHSGSDGNLFEGETGTLSLPVKHPILGGGTSATPRMIIEPAPWALDRAEIVECLTTSTKRGSRN